jgi:hypothetical protein
LERFLHKMHQIIDISKISLKKIFFIIFFCFDFDAGGVR